MSFYIWMISAGNVIRLEHDSLGRLLKRTDSAGYSVSYEYDNNRVVRITDQAGNREEFAYNNRKDLVSRTDRAGHVTRFVYDKTHSLREVIDPLNRLIERTNALPEPVPVFLINLIRSSGRRLDKGRSARYKQPYPM